MPVPADAKDRDSKKDFQQKHMRDQKLGVTVRIYFDPIYGITKRFPELKSPDGAFYESHVPMNLMMESARLSNLAQYIQYATGFPKESITEVI